ncbi:MAG: hypothetical protein DMD25_08180 [Gemmatimonadetes bacterium]|nr:MAG: hypothetical protein DMD25_08180 [Gemmatimonadota bacterium]
MARRPLLANAVEGLAEALRTERLEEIVQRLDLERGHGVAVEGRRKDDVGVVSELLEDFEPVALGHLDVEEQQIRPDRVDGPNGGRAVARLAGDRDPRHVGEQVAQLLARERLVIGDDGPDERRFALPHPRLAGSVTVAVKP